MIRIVKAEEWPAVSAALPPIGLLLDPLIPARGKTLLHGPPGSGKSAMMWGVGNAVALGDDYLGLKTKRGRALLVSTDMSLYELKHRWSDSFTPLFDILALPGFDCTKPQFTKSALYSAVKNYVEQANIQLVMFDALGGIHSGRSARDDEVADQVDHCLSAWLPDAGLLLLGHDRKMRFTRDGDVMEPGVEDFLGSQKWRANMTSQIHMWPVADYVSKIRHDKCQVALRLPEAIKLYIDIHGRAELWNEYRSKEVITMYRDAIVRLGLKNVPIMQQITTIARHYNKSERTIKRWRAMFLADSNFGDTE